MADNYTTLQALTYMFDGLGWFIGSFIIAVLWTAYLSVVADIKFIFRFIAIPAWLIFTVGLLVVIDGFMGFPYPEVPPKSQVVEYRVVSRSSPNDATIEAWMYLTNKRKTRLYRFPYTQPREEALSKAKEQQKRGFMVEVDLDPDRSRKDLGKQITSDDMLNYDIRHKGLPDKPGSENEFAEQPAPKQDMSDKYMIHLPGGGQIEVKPGQTISIGKDGEIQVSAPKHVPRVTTGNMRMEH